MEATGQKGQGRTILTMGWTPLAVGLAGILPLWILLRLLILGRSSYITDEVMSITIAQLRWPDLVRVVSSQQANMAFYYALLHFWVRLGTDELILRSLSAIFAIGTLPVIYVLGVRLFGHRVGVIATLLLALNAFFVWSAQFARGYSLVVLLATVSSVLFVRGIERSSPGTWVAYALTSALAMYSHFFGALVVVGHWASLVCLQRREIPWRALVTATAGFVLLVLPLSVPGVFALTRDTGHLSWVQKPNAWAIFSLFYSLSGESGKLLLLAYFISAVAALVAFVRQWQSSGRGFGTWRFGFLLGGLLVPIFLTFGASMIKPMFVDRFLIICLPPLVLLVAVGISRTGSQWVLAGALIVTYGLAIRGNFLPRDVYGDVQNWRGATSDILSQTQPEDSIIIDEAYGRLAFDFYLGRSGPMRQDAVIVFPAPWNPSTQESELRQHPSRAVLEGLPRRYRRVWLILFHDDAVVSRATHALLTGHYRLMTERKFTGIEIRLYKRD